MNSEGQLVIDVEYDENIQEENLEVAFDGSAYPNLARAIPYQTNFQIIPDDNDAAYYYDEETYKLADSIATFATVVGVLALVMFLLGMISGKMIGTEMMAVIQVSFVSLMTLQEVNPCFRALASLWIVNGYNALSPNNSLEDPYTS